MQVQKIISLKLGLTSLAICLFMTVAILTSRAIAQDPQAYLPVTEPCHLAFPDDHGPHPGYRTEWWYYTGNLKSEAGHRFGFQLTFFRNQIKPSAAKKKWPQPASAWRTQQIYIGHAAISAISNKQHLHAEIMRREALGMAGAQFDSGQTRIFIENWYADIAPSHHWLKASTDKFSFDLSLKPTKVPVLHGNGGYSQKGSSPERASCYYSFSRLQTEGIISFGGKTRRVEGLSWMDHEYSSELLEPDLIGWDWFSLQLADRTEIMIFLLRKKDGTLGVTSSGTFVKASGQTRHLNKDDFRVDIIARWKSPHTKAVYPAGWRIKIFPLAIDLQVTPAIADQEMKTKLSTGIIYWEGSVSIQGKKNNKPIEGRGYVEMTGYAKSFDAPI
jgi:predicted secreted hydrolase